MIDEEGNGPMRFTYWWAGLVECDICTSKHAAVVPIDNIQAEPEDIECNTCGRMSCNPVDYWEGLYEEGGLHPRSE